MSTIKGITDALAARAERWRKPDQQSVSYELLRYKLERSRYRSQMDLFELYWAEIVPGTNLGQVLSWSGRSCSADAGTLGAALTLIAYIAGTAIGAIARSSSPNLLARTAPYPPKHRKPNQQTR